MLFLALGYITDQWRLLEGLTDGFYEITRGYEVTLCKAQVSRLFVQQTINISTTIQNLKKDPSVPQQSCSDGIARKSPHVVMHKFIKLT